MPQKRKILSSKKSLSLKQEKRIASRLGGRIVPGSGNIPIMKSDVITGRFQVECKRTDKMSLILKKSWWQKISEEALGTGREPLLALEIQGLDLIVMRTDCLEELLSKENSE